MLSNYIIVTILYHYLYITNLSQGSRLYNEVNSGWVNPIIQELNH